MRERNLLKQAVESQKTLSRKAKARLEATSHISPNPSNPHSLANSRNGSRDASRAGSRAASSRGSDEEDDELLSEAGGSLFDWMPAFPEEDEYEEEFESTEEIGSITESLKEREFFRGSSKQRAAVLNAFGNTLANSYLGEEISNEADEILTILLKCLREGTDSPTTISALRVISLLVMSLLPDDTKDVDVWYIRPRDAIRACVYDSASVSGQVAAILALGTLVYFTCPDLEELDEVLGFLLEIAESDGASIEAKDNHEIIVAAMDEFGFLSTLLSREEDSVSFRAFEIFEAHLERSAPEILISCAQNLALLYEQCYSLKQDDDDSDDEVERNGANDEDDETEDMVARPYRKSSWIRRHNISITIDDYELKQLLRQRARSPLRWVKKDERKIVHRVLRDAIHALDHPWRGPRFSTAINQETGRYYGHRSKEAGYLLDRWWKVHRVMGIKRVLRQGFQAHLSTNPVIKASLRHCLEAPSRLAEDEEGPGHDELDYEARRSPSDDEDSDDEN